MLIRLFGPSIPQCWTLIPNLFPFFGAPPKLDRSNMTVQPALEKKTVSLKE